MTECDTSIFQRFLFLVKIRQLRVNLTGVAAYRFLISQLIWNCCVEIYWNSQTPRETFFIESRKVDFNSHPVFYKKKMWNCTLLFHVKVHFLTIFFRFYPYIMLVSCMLLLVTLVMYSAIPKLLNHYTRLMRHYVVAIMMAFSCMAVSHLKEDLTNTNPGACKFLGIEEFL